MARPRRGAGALAVGALLLFGFPARAATRGSSAQKPGHTSARSSRAPVPITNLVELTQPLRHLDDLLALPGFVRLMEGGNPPPKGQGKGQGSEATTMRGMLAFFRNSWPQTITVGMPDTEY